MIRTIEFDGQAIEVNSSAGWLFAYRNRFGHDILPDLMPIIESVLGAIASLIEESNGEANAETIRKAMNDDMLVDAFVKMAGMELTTVYQILWAMAYNADKSIKGPEEYFNGFDALPLDIIAPELFTAIVESSVSSKNAKRLLGGLKTLRRSESTLSTSQEPSEN